MTPKQLQYIITYDDFNDVFLCNINGETISANFVGEILSHIAKLYDYDKESFSEYGFKCMLEKDLKVTIQTDFDFC